MVKNVLGEEDGGISGGVPDWAPVAGGTVNFLNYPQMGAGENQKVRVSYSGNDEYCPCKNVEGTLTVNKAKVSVKVHSTSIYAEEAKISWARASSRLTRLTSSTSTPSTAA